MATINQNHVTWDDVRKIKNNKLNAVILLILITCIVMFYVLLSQNRPKLDVEKLTLTEETSNNKQKNTNNRKLTLCERIRLMNQNLNVQGKLRISNEINQKCYE